MKKFIFSFFLFSLLAAGAQGQKASCCKAGGKSAAACEAKAPHVASAGSFESSATAASEVAALDQSIETRTDPITGNVSYVRKETSPHDGTVSYVNLSFDSASGSFVDESAMHMGEGQNMSKPCTPGTGKACCSMGASSGKACCAGKAASVKSGEKTKS